MEDHFVAFFIVGVEVLVGRITITTGNLAGALLTHLDLDVVGRKLFGLFWVSYQ